MQILEKSDQTSEKTIFCYPWNYLSYPYNFLVSYPLSLKLFYQLSLIPETPNRASLTRKADKEREKKIIDTGW